MSAKAAATAASRARTASSPYGATRRAQKNPSEQAKFAFALLPARRGLVKRGRQKTLRCFGWHGLFLLRIAHNAARSAAPKGAPPPFIPRSLLKKAGENFIVWAGCVTAARKGLQSAALPRPRLPAPPPRTPCSRRVRIPWADGATAVPMAAEAAEAAGLRGPADPSGGPTA